MWFFVSVMALIAAGCLGNLAPPLGLRIEHLGVGAASGELLGVDTPSPRLSWLLPTATKGQTQAAFQARVTRVDHPAAAAPVVVWDSGTVASVITVVTVAGPLVTDTQYETVVRWANPSNGSDPAAAADPAWSAWSTPFRFSTGPFAEADWAGTVWLDGSTGGMAVSQLRASFGLSKPVAAARLHVAGTGWHRCWINDAPVSDLLLGHHTTSEARILYDSFDVAALLAPTGGGGRGDKNVIGCQLAAGWYGAKQGGGHTGARSIRLLLSVVHTDGTRSLGGTTEVKRL